MLAFDAANERFVGASKASSGGNIRHMYFNSEDNGLGFGVDTGYVVQDKPRD